MSDLAWAREPTRRSDRRGHRPPAAAHPQPVRQRRHDRVGRGDPQRRPARRATSPVRATTRSSSPSPGARAWWRASRAPTPTRRRSCSWATPTSSPSTPTAGRATRSAPRWSTASSGVGARSTCSTSPRRRRSRSAGSPTAGSVPAARSSTSRWPTRRRSARGAPTGCCSTSATPSTPTTCSPSRAGSRSRRPAGPRLPVLVGEKGTFWTKIRVHGTPGHGSQPFRTDNALDHRRRGGAPHRRVPTADADPRVVAPVRRGDALRPGAHRGAAEPRRLRRARWPSCRSASRGTGTRARTPRSRRPSRTAARRPT